MELDHLVTFCITPVRASEKRSAALLRIAYETGVSAIESKGVLNLEPLLGLVQKSQRKSLHTEIRQHGHNVAASASDLLGHQLLIERSLLLISFRILPHYHGVEVEYT